MKTKILPHYNLFFTPNNNYTALSATASLGKNPFVQKRSISTMQFRTTSGMLPYREPPLNKIAFDKNIWNCCIHNFKNK